MGWLFGDGGKISFRKTGATEDYAVMPEALRIGIAGLKGRAPVSKNKLVKVPVAEAFPVSTAFIMEERLREAVRQNAEDEIARNPEIGKLVLGKGIFMGVWEPKDRNGKGLDKKYNLFAAPEDLTNAAGQKILVTFREAVGEVTKLKNWNGHDGANFQNDTALYKALRKGKAIGKWFIPPRELLDGYDLDKNLVMPWNNLYALKDTGDFNGTLPLVMNRSDLSHWYWACTERRDNSNHIYSIRLFDGGENWEGENGGRLSCRPCRVELVL